MMSKEKLEEIADELDGIADGLSSTNALRARQIRGIVRTLVAIARNVPLPNEERERPVRDYNDTTEDVDKFNRSKGGGVW